MGSVWSKAKSPPAEEPVKTGSKRVNTEDNAPKEKRAKTGKERREHFKQNRTRNPGKTPKAKAKDGANAKEADSKDKNQVAKQNPRPPSNEPKEPRVPKKKLALLIGYSGTGYQGMQLNPAAKTIESELFDALCRAGAVSKDNSDDPKKIGWMRSARTDKGVHAACNLVSAKICMLGDGMVEKINAELPEQIRVWGYVRTKRSFHAKTACDSRVYEYLMPTYVFLPPSPKQHKEKPDNETDLKMAENGQFYYISPSTPEELAEKDAYRISEDTLQKFREALAMFVGTHNFHNYTIAKSFKEASAKRFIKSITVSDPIYIEGTEWLSVKLHGQSFMLHQIRKMISMATLCIRSGTPLSLIPKTFEQDKINIPKAPAVGLLLERPLYQSYNKKLMEDKNPTENEPINFDLYNDKIEAFKEKWIYSKIFETERCERQFDAFFLSVDSVSGPDFSYLNKDGVIPDNAILSTKYSVPRDASDNEVEE